jgi:hypothetical protein
MLRTTSAAVLALVTGAAHAATTLASGPFYSGPNGATVVCRVTNYHDTSVPVTKVAVLNDLGTKTLATSGCLGTTLAPNVSCVVTAPIPQPPSEGYLCKIGLGGIAEPAYTRLTEQLVDSSGNTLVSEPGH